MDVSRCCNRRRQLYSVCDMHVGSLTGSVGIFPIAGLICEYGLDGKGFDGGWPAIFYIFGKLITGILYCI